MAIIYTGEMIAKLRKRKQWQQEVLLEKMEYYSPSVYRLEKGKQHPGSDTLKIILKTFDVPMQEMICPHLENQPMHVYTLRYMLTQSLNNKNLQEAEELFNELSQIMNLDGKINQQFYLCRQAKIMELKNEIPDNIITVVTEGIKLTFENFDENSPGDVVLIFEEPELFHVLANCYAKKGKFGKAIKIITDTYNGLQLLPIGERERDRRILPMLISLTELYYKIEKYKKALNICETGLKLSASSYYGQYTPDLLYIKANILFKSNSDNEYKKIIKMVYAGYILLGEKQKALNIISEAKEKCNFEFETYGTENSKIPPFQKIPYSQGEMVACSTIGEMIRKLRKKAGLSLKELSQGICSIANLGKIENDEIQGHINYIEPILQRLGRDPLLYCNFFLSKDDFETRELRDSINLLISQRKYRKATKILNRLKKYKAYKSKANLQYIKSIEAEIFASNHQESHQETQKMLLDAIKITIPQFDESHIERYPLSLDESITISELAISVMESGDLERAANIYDSLINNLNRRFIDEHEKFRVYDSTIANYTTCLGRLNKRHKALDIIEEAEIFNRSRGRLMSLDLLIGNKAYNLLKLGFKEQSLSYFVLSYYCFAMFSEFGENENMKVSQRLIKENFELLID